MPVSCRWLIGILAIGLAACSAAPESSTSVPSSAAPAASSPSAAASASGEREAVTVLGEGAISGPDEEYRVSFTPDGQTAYFARGDGFFPQTRRATIMESQLVDGAWSEPTVVPFSGTYPDIDPWVAPDGESIYFSSIRPVGGEERTDVELWRVDRAGDGWGDPVHLAALGSVADELGASVAADGSVWFASDRSGGAGGWDLYTAAATAEGFALPKPITDVNSGIWEFNPAIDADGATLLFTSIGRGDGSGLGDLYVTTRTDEAWSEPEPLAVNTPADEYHPSLSPDGQTLYFVRRTGQGDLYETAWPE